MVWPLSRDPKPSSLASDARRSRSSPMARRAAIFAVVFYNIVGITDIVSTVLALESGAGVEANPFLRMLMSEIGAGWIIAKLLLQGVLSGMVLWFPHWIVIAMFFLATIGNAVVVFNNFVIGGLF